MLCAVAAVARPMDVEAGRLYQTRRRTRARASIAASEACPRPSEYWLGIECSAGAAGVAGAVEPAGEARVAGRGRRARQSRGEGGHRAARRPAARRRQAAGRAARPGPGRRGDQGGQAEDRVDPRRQAEDDRGHAGQAAGRGPAAGPPAARTRRLGNDAEVAGGHAGPARRAQASGRPCGSASSAPARSCPKTCWSPGRCRRT